MKKVIRRDKQGKFIKGNQIRLGVKLSTESKQKMSLARMGKSPWNKGKKNVYSTNIKQKMSEGHKKTYLIQDVWNKGKHKIYSQEQIKKMSLFAKSRKGKIASHWKGGKPKCKECNKELTNYGRIRCLKCHLGTRRMTTMEKKVQKVIDKYYLPYVYVGNGKFYIERKNPDFINTNGEKKAIEVYWNRQKEEFKKGGVKGWKAERVKIFSNYGWKIIFLDEHSMTEEKILNFLMKEET